MAKKESTFLNMFIVLTIICVVSAAILGIVFQKTEKPIAEAKQNKTLEAIKKVVPAFNNNPNEEKYLLKTEDGFELEAYPTKMDSELQGTAVKTVSKQGFGGEVWLMVGFMPDGTVIDISVLDHKETPGLGTKMNDENFKSQFRKKNPESFNLKVKKDGGDVDAITAATISSRAFTDAINRAHTALMKGGNQ